MTKPHVLIGLTGPAGCGKDTVADLLVTHAGFKKIAFADPLRAEISDAFQIDIGHLTRRETKEHPMSAMALIKCADHAFVDRMVVTKKIHHEPWLIQDYLNAPRSPRQIMQWWGTDYRRRQKLDYWLSKTARRIHDGLADRSAPRIVVTDLRFDNEADLITRHGGLIWRVTRPGCEVAPNAHASEVTGEAFKPEAVINNTHDIKHLQQLVLGEFWAHDAGLAGVTVEIND
jgi:hypothetical protein